MYQPNSVQTQELVSKIHLTQCKTVTVPLIENPYLAASRYCLFVKKLFFVFYLMASQINELLYTY